MPEEEMDMLTAPRTSEQEDARRLGEKMGAEGLMQMAGITPIRQNTIRAGSRIMNPERLNQATRTLMQYKSSKASVNKRVIKAQQWWKLKN